MQDLFDLFVLSVPDKLGAYCRIDLYGASRRVRFCFVGCSELREVVAWDVQCLGVLVCGVQGIAKIVKEGITAPSQSSLYIAVRKALTMKEITCRDSNGMRCPFLEGFVTVCQFEYSFGYRLEEYTCLLGRDVTTFVRVFACRAKINSDGLVVGSV